MKKCSLAITAILLAALTLCACSGAEASKSLSNRVTQYEYYQIDTSKLPKGATVSYTSGMTDTGEGYLIGEEAVVTQDGNMLFSVTAYSDNWGPQGDADFAQVNSSLAKADNLTVHVTVPRDPYTHEISSFDDVSSAQDVIDKKIVVGTDQATNVSEGKQQNTSTSSDTAKVTCWEDAKREAIGAYMTENQVNLDNPNLVYDNEGTDDHGYVIHCYENVDDHTATVFWYSVNENGDVYDIVLQKYVG